MIQRVKEAVRCLVKEELHNLGTKEGLLVHSLRGQLAVKDTAIRELQDSLAKARQDLLRVQRVALIEVPGEPFPGPATYKTTPDILVKRYVTQRRTIRRLLAELEKGVVPTWTSTNGKTQAITDMPTAHLVNIIRKFYRVIPAPPVLQLIEKELATRKDKE